MAEKLPLISIGMPVFNCADTIGAAIQSIISQSFKNWELLIMDDGSTDATQALLKGFTDSRIRVFSDGKNKGLAARLNEAVRESRGQYFARMDGDDIAYPDRLTRQLEYLLAHPEVDLVGAWVLVFNSDGLVRGVRRAPELHECICAAPWSGFPVVHPTFIGRRSWFERFLYDEGKRKAQDQVLLAASFSESRFANVQEVLLGYREDVPGFGKLLLSRWCMMRGIASVYIRQQQYIWALKNIITQSFKIVADLLLSAPALRHWQLARRSEPLCEKEHTKWKKLIQHLDEEDGVHG